ncbi:MAG: 3-dehydroquinate synthase [Candidatus Omnitrophota bacterium]
MKIQKVSLGNRRYNIFIGDSVLKILGEEISKSRLSDAVFIVTNTKIKRLYGETVANPLKKTGIDFKFHTVPDSETSKSNLIWIKAVKALADFDKGRGSVVAALGGGVIGDLAGFVAATYRRGVPYIQIPTTLLAQVDSSIGGKVAIDIECAKNLIGAFYQPKAVFSDVSVLRTLPKRQLCNGLAEVIKYGVILDSNFFSFLEKRMSEILKFDKSDLEHIVDCCSKLKAEVVEIDEDETLGYRSILNFGHTLGHAVETAASYSKVISHGEAISVGMLAAFDIAVELGMADNAQAQRLENLLKKSGLPTKFKNIDISAVLKAIVFDKKVVKGEKRWVLPVDIGHVVVCSNIPSKVIENAVVKRLS